jgi:hypothetical protein
MTRITDTPGLIALMDDADAHERNRRVTDEARAMLDPDGTHICSFEMIHEHIAGEPAPAHLRTRWLTKVTDSDQPVEMWLDVGFDVCDQHTRRLGEGTRTGKTHTHRATKR